MTSRGRKLSLGGALFGWPAADDCDSPDESAPESWLLLLRTQHATSDFIRGALTACRAGREFWTHALQTAPKVTLTLDYSTETPAQEGFRRLCAVQDALATRGELTQHMADTACEARLTSAWRRDA